ncbi:hypothetical protein MB901379_04896 [Mycobacterium basiliense]|uniref:Emopamil binding protein n=1 Tax=Mycobacterium basiliense TaxID=2094119 RepID=A0A447GLA4_9MYCO|nr:hypothetical protein [Mycobacterium basiliense]VDM91277.1 hypothetical protein MB901379_04896 [Mycobacterium basiliense]
MGAVGSRNRASATTAGFVALIVGGYQLWNASELLQIASFYWAVLGPLGHGFEEYTRPFHHFVAWLNAEAALSAAAGIALLLGAVLVCARNPFGPRLLAGGCVVVFVHTGIGWVVAARMLSRFAAVGAYDEGLLWFHTPSRLAIIVLAFVLPVIAAYLALWPGRLPGKLN